MKRYKEVYDNPKYYNQETGDINWPPHNGFEGEPVKMKLEKGMLIDRFGGQVGASFLQKEFHMNKERLRYTVTRQIIMFMKCYGPLK